MKHFLRFLVFLTVLSGKLVAQPANDNCANAANLSVNAACIAGTTSAGTTQAGELTSPSCAAAAFNQTVWYKFTATASHMYVQLNLTTFSGSGATWGPGYWTSAVYNTSSCLPTATSLISCNTSNTQGNADGIIVNEMFGLTVGNTNLIQIGYRTGMGVNLIPNFCIKVGDQFTPDCNTCANPCGPACGFTTIPTAAQVTANCPSYPQIQYNEGSVTDTQCYTFNAVNDTVDFQVIVNSTCGSGNVVFFSWNLYSFGNCGAGPIQSGNLNNLRFTGLTIGAGYVFCYTFTVPGSCYHTAYYPYFVGATPLPVQLLTFTGEQEKDDIRLQWTTATEINNDYFELERSSDHREFTPIGRIAGAGNSTVVNSYEFIDEDAQPGVNYYRLRQVDFDGKSTEYPVIAVRYTKSALELFPNPVSELSLLSYTSEIEKQISLKVFDVRGQLIYAKEEQVFEGNNDIRLQASDLSTGIYVLQISDSFSTEYIRFTRN